MNIFLPRSFLLITWTITESDSKTKMEAKSGRRSVVLVSIAITPIVMPRDIEPVSPIKKHSAGQTVQAVRFVSGKSAGHYDEREKLYVEPANLYIAEKRYRQNVPSQPVIKPKRRHHGEQKIHSYFLAHFQSSAIRPDF